MLIEKLITWENFSDLKFAMKVHLELNDIWSVVETKETEDLAKDKKSLSKLIP